MKFTRLTDFLQNPTESKSQRMLSKSLGVTSKRHDMCKISNYQWIWMNLTRVLPCEYSHFSSPRRPLGTFCRCSSSNNKKKKHRKNEHPLLKSTNLIYVWQHVNCVCAFVNGVFFNIKIDCAKIGENRGSKDISYSPFYGTGGRDPGNMWIVSIRLVVSCFCFGRESHFIRASSYLKGILRGSSFFTFGGVLKKMKKLIRFSDNWRSWCSLHM